MGVIEKKMLDEISLVGLKCYDVNDLFKQKRIENNVVKVILRWIEPVFNEHIGTGIITAQSLLRAVEPFNPTELQRLFQRDDINFSVKSSIGFVIVKSKTTDISGWLREQLTNNNASLERASLIVGLPKKGGFNKNEELIVFCESIFEKYFFSKDLLDIFKIHGSKSCIDFLLLKAKGMDKKNQKKLLAVVDFLQRQS